jgi:hypothetical protein
MSDCKPDCTCAVYFESLLRVRDDQIKKLKSGHWQDAEIDRLNALVLKLQNALRARF